MCDKKAADSTEKDIARIFKDMSYAPVQEGCTIAEVRNLNGCVLAISVGLWTWHGLVSLFVINNFPK